MKGSELARLVQAIKTLEDMHRMQGWRPGWIAPRMTPSAALVANNAIGRMMR